MTAPEIALAQKKIRLAEKEEESRLLAELEEENSSVKYKMIALAANTLNSFSGINGITYIHQGWAGNQELHRYDVNGSIAYVRIEFNTKTKTYQLFWSVRGVEERRLEDEHLEYFVETFGKAMSYWV